MYLFVLTKPLNMFTINEESEMIYDIEGLRKTISLIQQLKSKLAYMFRLFSVYAEEDNEFWSDLAKREYKRIQIIGNILGLVELNPDKFYYNLNFADSTILSLISDVEEKTEFLINGQMSSYECLVFAKTIMNTMVEKEYYHIVESDDNDMSTIIAEIVYDAAAHYEKFADRIQKHMDSKDICRPGE